jgi:hypothetical protein
MVDGPNSGATSVFSDASASSSVNLMTIQVNWLIPSPKLDRHGVEGQSGNAAKKEFRASVDRSGNRVRSSGEVEAVRAGRKMAQSGNKPAGARSLVRPSSAPGLRM